MVLRRYASFLSIIPVVAFVIIVSGLIPGTSTPSQAQACAPITFPYTLPDNAPATLVTAIECANANGTADIIDLNGFTVSLLAASPYATYQAPTGLPQITTDITLRDGTIEHDLSGGGFLFRTFDIGSTGTLNLVNVTLLGDSAPTPGGAFYNLGTLNVTSSTMTGYDTNNRGGVLFNGSGSTANFTNALFYDNNAVNAHVMDNLGSVTIINSTFDKHTSISNFGVILEGTGYVIRNSILWNPGSGPGQISAGNTVSDSIVKGGYSGGTNILDTDPLFVNEASNDFRLQLTSPAVNAGADTYVPTDSTDVDGDSNTTEATPDRDLNPRIVGLSVDMGAFERQDVTPVDPCLAITFPYTLPDNTPATLIQAIECANANGTADVIDLDGQTVTLTVSFGDFDGATGLPRIDTEMLIRNGTITRSGANQFRLIQVGSTGVLSLHDMALTNGGGSTYAEQGGNLNANTDSSVTILRSSITGGSVSTSFNAGGIFASGAFTMANSTVSGNTAGRGGGINLQNGPALITNSVISGNVATSVLGGGAMYLPSVDVTIVNSTITGNYATATGATRPGGIVSDISGANLIVRNSIVWGNRNGDGTDSQIVNDSGTNTATNSIIQGGQFGALNVDPLFVTPLTPSATPSTAGNFQLSDGSPAIDAGSNSLIPGGITTDLNGSPRRYDDTGVADTGSGTAPIVDLGAYEKQTNTPVDPCVGISFPYTLPNNLAATLITAMECANANGPSADTIDLDGQIVTLTASYADYTGATGLPQITTTITLENGAIVRSGGASQFRLLNVGATGSLTVDGLTLSGGSLSSSDNAGAIFNDGGTLNILNSTITNNSAGFGGAFYNLGSTATMMLVDSQFTNNSATQNGGLMMNDGGSVTILRSTVSGNSSSGAAGNGAIYNFEADLDIIDSTFSGNASTTSVGAVQNFAGTTNIANSVFAGNSATNTSGAVLNNAAGVMTITNSLFTGNSAASTAGAVFNNGSTLTITNSTFAGNNATNGGGIYAAGGTTTVTNSILWGNSSNALIGATITYSVIEGGFAGTGNLNVNPLFVAPVAFASAPTSTGNYRLQDNSPAVDAGSNAAVPVDTYDLNDNSSTTDEAPDLDGNPRRYNDTGVTDTGTGTAPIVDMGAYEKQTNSPVAFPQDVDYCNLQFPTSFTAAAGSTSPVIYGRIYEDDGGILTSTPGAHPSIIGQLGHGPLGSDPRGGNPAWQWFPTTYNVQVGNDDEYQATFTVPFAPTNTQLSYTYRFSVDSGANYTYCDSDGNGTNGGLGFSTADLGTLTISPGGQPTISINDVALNEGNSGTTNFNFTFSLNGPSLSAVTFDIGTANNTATVANGDYVANSQTGFVIPAGQTSTTFTVVVNGDTTFEPNETFFVNLTNIVGATAGDVQGTGTIVNDDVDPCFAYSFPYTMSGNTPAELIQAINCANANGASVDVIDLDGQTVTLTASYTSAYGSGTGLPEITTAVVIQNGTITRSSADLFRFFIYSGSSSLTLNNITLSNGNPEWDGGAIWGMGSSTLIINNSRIIGNYGNYGGAIFIPSSGTAVITNTLLSGNRAASPGGAIRNRGNLTLNNSTIAANFTTAGTEGGGGIANNGGTVVLNNSIVYGNEASSFPATNDIRGTYTANNSLVGVNPSFVNLLDAGDTAPTTGGDYRLADFSVAIDAGSNSLIPGGVTTDLDGNPRRYDDTGVADTGVGTAPIVDLGAYEKQTNSVIDPCAAITFPYTMSGNTPAELIQAINCANANGASADVIDLDGQTVTLTDSYGDYDGATGLPQITTEMTIHNGTVTRSGSNQFRLLAVSGTGNLTLRDMTLTNGGGTTYANNGGIIITNSGSTLTVVNSTLSGGFVGNVIGNARFGGAIWSGDTLTIANSTISGNTAATGGGLYIAGSEVSATITNSVISGNVGNGSGAIFIFLSDVTITNSTITGNYGANTSPASSGGIFVSSADLTLRNSIVWSNENNGNTAPQIVNFNGAITAANSIIQGGQFGALDADPLFVTPLTASATPSTAGDFQLSDNSPAIDAGANANVPSDPLDVNSNGNTTEDAPDRAGNPRRYDDLGVVDTGVGTTPIVDIGAYEKQTDTLGPCDPISFPYTMSGNTPAELIQAIECANANATADVIDLDGQTVTLTDSYGDYEGATGLPQITTNITVRNGTITRSGSNQFRLLSVSATGNLTLRDMTLTNGGGATYANDGGIIQSSSTLTVISSTLSGGYVSNTNNGGALTAVTTLTVANSTISGNTAGRGGGVVIVNGPATITNSVISGNVATGTLGGGAMFIVTDADQDVTIVNSTITGNYAIAADSIASGGIFGNVSFPNLILRNSIVWGNSNTGNTAPQIVNNNGTNTVTNSLIQGGQFGALNADPLFVAPLIASATPSTAGDFQLSDSSPAIDAGANADVPVDTFDLDGDSNTTEDAPDFAGNIRRYDDTGVADTGTGTAPIVDMGAYEKQTDSPLPEADLSITKTDDKVFQVSGINSFYTIVVSNAGPSDVIGATVADTFPASITSVAWTCVGAGGATCAASGSGDINETVNLPAGSSVTFTANTSTDPGATGTLSNTATVTAPAGVIDPTPANNSATDTTEYTQTADLRVTKTDGQTSMIPGNSVTYTIVASNLGPSGVAGATVTDTFSADISGVTWTCVGAGGGTCTATGSGDINEAVNLPPGGSVTFIATGTVSPAATGTLFNGTTVTPPTGAIDPSSGNNSTADTTTLTPQADLSITKTDGVTTATPGTSITYTIVASNAGPSDVTGATVADTFPANITSATWTCVGAGGGTCTAVGAGNINDTVNLPAGGSVTYTISATISPAATGTLSNTATVSSGVTDPNPANNSATDSTTLTAPAGITITPTTVNVTEGGATDTYTIVLDAPPSADVTVELSYGGQILTSTNGTDFFPSPVLVTFTTANWDSPRTITVQAVDDLVVEGAHNTSVDHDLTSSDPLYNGLTGETVNVEITDNDVADVTISETSLTLSESGLTQAYTINLETVPTGQVQITVTPDGQCDIGAGPGVGTVLSFTSTAAQTITVAAVDDLVAEGPHTCTISQVITTTAAIEYSTGPLASVIGNITDNDTAGVTVTPTTVNVTEGGATATYGVSLNTIPTSDVTITVTGDAQASASPTSLTFTPANWNIAQNVTVMAVDDLVVEGAHTGTITHSATGGGYTGVSIASVIGNITDNDTAGVTVTPTTVSVTEGGATGTYTIVLNAQPNADVTITVNGDAQASVSPTSLTFTPANWNIAQNVTVTAVDDLVVEGAHTGTIAHSATGGGYTGVSIASVIGNITDNDVAASTDLLKNGGFETAGGKAKKAKRWKSEAPAVTDKRICRPAIAFEGSCAYRFHFKGTIVGGGAKRAIVQKILSPVLNAGDTLDFSFYVRTSSLTIAGRARVIAYYSGGGKQVIKLIIPAGSSPYTLYAGSAVLTGTPASITVTFEPRRSKGTMFVDGASLTATASTRSFLGADVLPVPEAPEGFRR